MPTLNSKMKVGFLILAASAMLLPFENCSYPKVTQSSNSSQGGTGADGKVYASYAQACPSSPSRAANLVLIAKDQQSAQLLRKNCTDLVVPQSVDVSSLQFSFDSNTLFQLNGQIFDLQSATSVQRVTVQICKTANVQAVVWQNVGQASQYYGSVALANGSTTGSLGVTAPSSTPPEYRTANGQTSQFDLALSSASAASLTYQIGSGAQTSVSGLSCASQAAPNVPDDGSKGAPAGSAPRSSLLDGYAVRPSWMVAGVDYAVGFPAGQSLKDPATDTALASNPNVTVDSSIGEVQVHGNGVTLDGYDFTLGSYTVNVVSGSGTIIQNSKLASVISQAGSTGLTIRDSILDGGGANGPGALVAHSGGGSLSLSYNWIRNFSAHAVDADGGGTVVLKYNLIEDGGLKSGAGLSWLQLSGSAAFSSVSLEFNTASQPLEPSVDEGFKFGNVSGGVQGDIAYNTLIATAPSGKLAMSYLLHVGGGGPVTAAVHDNYFDVSGAYGPFYPGINGGATNATYSNNLDLVSGASLTTSP